MATLGQTLASGGRGNQLTAQAGAQPTQPIQVAQAGGATQSTGSQYADFFKRPDIQAGLLQFLVSGMAPGSTAGTALSDAFKASNQYNVNQEQAARQQWADQRQQWMDQQAAQVSAAQMAEAYANTLNKTQEYPFKQDQLRQQSNLESRRLDIEKQRADTGSRGMDIEQQRADSAGAWIQAQIQNLKNAKDVPRELDILKEAMDIYGNVLEVQGLTGEGGGFDPAAAQEIYQSMRDMAGLTAITEIGGDQSTPTTAPTPTQPQAVPQEVIDVPQIRQLQSLGYTNEQLLQLKQRGYNVTPEAEALIRLGAPQATSQVAPPAERTSRGPVQNRRTGGVETRRQQRERLKQEARDKRLEEQRKEDAVEITPLPRQDIPNIKF